MLVWCIRNGLAFLTAAIFLSGCAREQEATATALPVEETAPRVAAATETAEPSRAPTSTPRPTTTAEPTPVTPQISVNDQPLKEDGLLSFESVTSTEASWLVVFADEDGTPGAVLGYEAVDPAVSEPVNVTIDPWAATPTLHARLHVDAGNVGTLDYPGNDEPVTLGRDEVMRSFAVDLQLPVPEITVSDQEIGMDGVVRVEEVFALQPGWLVIHTSEEGSIGQAIGQAPIEEGENIDLEVVVRWREASGELAAVLHQDKEQPGGFDVAADLPVLVSGAPVTADFSVELPPDVFAYDQPVIDGKIALERVISNRPGWIVVYTDNEGQLDLIIGFERVAQGINEQFDVEIVETAATPQLYLALHEESENPSEFNFPAADPPATYDGETVAPTVVRINPGNYLITRDQELSEEGEVTIPLVVTDLDTWLVLYEEDEAGRPDRIVNQLWLPAGVNRDRRVAVPPNLAGESLLALLHQDAGDPEVFDYPDGDDVPLQRNRQVIYSPFLLLERSAGEGSSP